MATTYPELSSTDLTQIPSGKAPPGITPNYVNPETRAPITVIAVTVPLALMVMFVVFRLYVEIGINRRLERTGLLYLRLFGINKQMKILTFIAVAINLAVYLINTIGNSVLCVPAPGQSWQIASGRHSCIVTADLLSVYVGDISVFTDFFIILIPLPVIWTLQMSTKKKVGISATFLTGLLVCAASALNLAFRIWQYRDLYYDNT
ncbi:MAG: hypothetical protein Q9228_007375 [Teloschistes exilis]